MTFKNYRQQSRDVQWGCDFPEGRAPTLDQINAGSLLRIADATELMAKRHTELIDEAAREKRSAEFWRKSHDRAVLQLRAARGQITKLKRKLDEQTTITGGPGCPPGVALPDVQGQAPAQDPTQTQNTGR